jgi:hypothetical protein
MGERAGDLLEAGDRVRDERPVGRSPQVRSDRSEMQQLDRVVHRFVVRLQGARCLRTPGRS